MKHNQDWTVVDLEALAPDALPVTSYKRAMPTAEYDAAYTHWGEDHIPARDHYRIAWRNMAANTGERTLIPAIIPPGTAHVDGLYSLGHPLGSVADLIAIQASMASLVSDVAIRVAPKSTIRSGSAKRLPYVEPNALSSQLALRALRLTACTSGFRLLWEEAVPTDSSGVHWTGGLDYPGRPALDEVTSEWTPETPLRRDSDRRQALLEIDAIVALSLGVTTDELCTVYRTQFAVLYGYDRNSYFYDANGRLVPGNVMKVFKQKGEAISETERTAVHPGSDVSYTYELPFVTLDREADMRRAYAYFEQMLGEQA